VGLTDSADLRAIVKPGPANEDDPAGSRSFIDRTAAMASSDTSDSYLAARSRKIKPIIIAAPVRNGSANWKITRNLNFTI